MKFNQKWGSCYLSINLLKEVLETDLNILLKEYEFTNGYNPVEHVKSRIKSSESAY